MHGSRCCFLRQHLYVFHGILTRDEEGMMKRLILVATMLFFVSPAGAGEIYGGFSSGNPELFDDDVTTEGTTARAPEIGSSVDVYRGFSWNPDLLASPVRGGSGEPASPADVYHGFERGNPDL